MTDAEPDAVKRLSIAELEAKARRRPAGYLEQVMSLALPGSHDGVSILVREAAWEAVSRVFRRRMARRREPGDWAAVLIELATGDTAGCVKCEDFAQWMNELGWRGCLRERKAIAARLCAEAHRRADRLAAEAAAAQQRAVVARRGADAIDPDRAWTLLLAAMRELNQRRRE